MRKIDLAFVGNGIISFVSALTVKAKHPELKVAIIGPSQRLFSASIAAGAMQAVFCEVEETFHKLPRDREIFDVALEARTLWRALLEKFNLNEVVTAQSTIMYRRKYGTLFEEVNFETACDIARDHQCLEDVSLSDLEKVLCGSLKPADAVAKKFNGEFSIDTELFFNKTQQLLENMGVSFIDNVAESANPNIHGIEISLKNGEKLQASKVVIAAGTSSSNLIPQELSAVPLYHGVGTAMVLDSAPDSYRHLNTVVRTTNRGGAQCGMHLVPRRNGGFYLGAGNYFSDKVPAHRAETIRYLIDLCEVELFGKQAIYKAKVDLFLGSRPKSVDGYPIVGTFESCPALFVATGMYRVGLTIAPSVAAEVCRWYEGKQGSAAFKNCSPGRELHSYAPLEVATRYYSESRISNLVEHGILNLEDKKAIADKKIELEAAAKKFNADIVKRHNFAQDFVVDPDMYAILIEAEVRKEASCEQVQNSKRSLAS